jgi:HSP20 family protein
MAETRELEVVSSGPFSEFGDLGGISRYVDQLMDEMLARWGAVPRAVRPRLDVTETDASYAITAEVPGLRKSDLTVECRDGVLTIRGEKRIERDEKRERARLLERSRGTFSRSLVLPRDANPDKIEARCEDGVLRIEIEKKPEAKPKQIAIKG